MECGIVVNGGLVTAEKIYVHMKKEEIKKWYCRVESLITKRLPHSPFFYKVRGRNATIIKAIKLLLYKTLIRSKVEYAASVLNPFHDNLTYSLEMVQNNSTRFIMSSCARTASVTSTKTDLELSSLSSSLKICLLCPFHPICHHPSLHDDFIYPSQFVSSRVDHRPA